MTKLKIEERWIDNGTEAYFNDYMEEID